MIAAARPPEFLFKGYLAFLATVSVAGFVAGAAINYTHARNNPGADPYMPRPQIIVPIAPAAPAVPVLREKVKVLPPAGEAPEQAPLVSGIEPNAVPVLAHDTKRSVKAKAVGAIEYTTPATTGASGVLRATAGANDCAEPRAGSKLSGAGNSQPTLEQGCRSSGSVGQGSIGEMTIGAGSVTVVPTQ